MQYAMLSSLARCGPIASLALTERLSIDRTALYRALVVLERHGLVQGRPGRGRERILLLTEAGLDVHQRAAQDWSATQEGFSADFGPDWPRLLSLLARARAVAEGMRPPVRTPVETTA